MEETPGDRIEILRQKLSSLRPNLISHLMNRDGAAVELQPVSPFTGTPRLTSTDGKVNPPGRRDETNGVFTGHSIGRRAPGPLASFLSSVLQPQVSEADLEAVRHAERQKVLDETEREKVELKQREEDDRRKVRDKPAVF